jgi:hypothetical protein
MSSLPNNLERPSIGHARNSASYLSFKRRADEIGSFRTRALAVAAAHRLTHSPENEPRSPIIPTQDGNTHEDIEAEAGTSPMSRTSNLLSPGGSKPKYRWLSSPGGGGTGDEPGVDVRSRRDEESYGHLDGRTQISVCTGRVTCKKGDADNRLLIGRMRRMMRVKMLGLISLGRG